jgi:tail tube protein
MSETAQNGYCIIGVQTAKGTPAVLTASNALKLTSATPSGQAELLDDDAEIGGGRDFEASSAVLGGFNVAGDLEGLFRAKTIGYLLMAAGFAPAAPVQDGVTGAYKHTFTPTNALNYLTMLIRWGNAGVVRKMSDCLVNEITFELEANGKVTWSASVIGCEEVADVAGMTPLFETTPVANYAGSAAELDGLGTYRWESMSLGINNNLSDDEWVIGSRKLDDVTGGAREVTVGGTIKVGNNSPSLTDLYKAAVYGDVAATAPGGSDPYHTDSALTFGTTKLVGTSITHRFGMKATVPDLVIQGFPLEASGDDRLTIDIEGRAYKGVSAAVSLELTNDRATVYAAT